MLTKFVLWEIILIILIELFTFGMVLNKHFKLKINILKSLLIVLIANLILPLIGLIFSFFEIELFNLTNLFNNLFYIVVIYILISFILSVFIDWGIYILFLFKENITKKNLFITSLIVNLVSHLVYGILFILAMVFLGSIGTF